MKTNTSGQAGGVCRRRGSRGWSTRWRAVPALRRVDDQPVPAHRASPGAGSLRLGITRCPVRLAPGHQCKCHARITSSESSCSPLGDVVGVQERLRDPPNAAVTAFGIRDLRVGQSSCCSRWGVRRDERSGGSYWHRFDRLWPSVRRNGHARSVLVEVLCSINVSLHDI